MSRLSQRHQQHSIFKFYFEIRDEASYNALRIRLFSSGHHTCAIIWDCYGADSSFYPYIVNVKFMMM